MRLIEKQMNNAIRCNQNFQKDNTTVINIGTKSFVYLHGNHIATVGSDFLQVFDGGWQSNTTKSRLNALINEFCYVQDGVFQQNFCWFINTAAGVRDFINGYEFALASWLVTLMWSGSSMTRNSTKCGTYAPKQWSAKDGTLTTANYPSAHMMTTCAVTLTQTPHVNPNPVARNTLIIMSTNATNRWWITNCHRPSWC